MNLHCDGLADLNRAGWSTARYGERGARNGRLGNVNHYSATISYRQSLRRGIADSHVAETHRDSAGRQNARATRNGRSRSSLCGTGVTGAARKANNRKKRSDRREEWCCVGQFRALRTLNSGECEGELELVVGVGSHVTLSVGSQGRAQLLAKGRDKVSPLSPVPVG